MGKAENSKIIKRVIKLNFPLNWKLKLDFAVLPDRPTPSIIKGKKWIRGLRLNEEIVPIIVEVHGSIDRPILVITMPSIPSEKQKTIENFVFDYHGLKDVRELYDFMEEDDVLRRIKKKLYGFGGAGLMSASVFEGIVKAIIQQQISLRAAESITANLVERYGGKTKIVGEFAYEFPDAETLADLKLNELRNCGLSWKKAEYIRELSREVVGGFDPENLREKDYEEIVETLTSFKGIGRWSAELVMVASIGMNIIPADDLGVRRAISHFYFDDKPQTPSTIKRFAEERFGKFLRDCLVYLLMAYRMGLEL